MSFFLRLLWVLVYIGLAINEFSDLPTIEKYKIIYAGVTLIAVLSFFYLFFYNLVHVVRHKYMERKWKIFWFFVIFLGAPFSIGPFAYYLMVIEFKKTISSTKQINIQTTSQAHASEAQTVSKRIKNQNGAIHIGWKIFFWYILIGGVGSIINWNYFQVWQKIGYFVGLPGIVAFYGYCWQKKIMKPILWKSYFFVLLIWTLASIFIVNPQLPIAQEFSIMKKLLLMQIIPLLITIPYFIAIYRYAYKAEWLR